MKLFYRCQLINSHDQTFLEFYEPLNFSIFVNRNCKTLVEINEELAKMRVGAKISHYDNPTELLIENPEFFFNFFLSATIKDGRDSIYIKKTVENLKTMQNEYCKMLENFKKATSIT
ncbi:MAG: hypothetical protein KBD76_16040 [Bacteriovorax sp.]|nr:hypothetical protein [Bacteriovorax sp.]